MKATTRALLFVGLVYALVGLTFGALAGGAAGQSRIAWRWTAWAVSAVAFVLHIGFERLSLRSSPQLTALRVACAAALGGFALAFAANLNGLLAGRPQSARLLLALLLWPALTGVPAFVVAFVGAFVLTRARRA